MPQQPNRWAGSMAARDRYPGLHNFLAAYFHEDWDVISGPTWEHVALRFCQEAGPSERRAVADQIDAFLTDPRDDAKLRDVVFRELGCYYSPCAADGGLGMRSWLLQLAQALRLPA